MRNTKTTKKIRAVGRPQKDYPEILKVLKEKKMCLNTCQIFEELKTIGLNKNRWSRNDDKSLKPLCHKTIKTHLEKYVKDKKVIRVNKNNKFLEEQTKKR